ncbi:2-succinyl-6-hydroxy-2,4-cyclohexadiene-1-carboxylate synthase [Saccharothrix variisporea]|uniref:2-succinyl-6-hydroxy-2, 4-cyclohexadiene-1-carboxylate synthase n=1 Tax=Saccharothrix variisporea TaxID=543527 RepID=A0A495XPB5_9PSEU|nr:2-succinyl-6-hydroxy-2,4-cyclohexadiene-1-carboxylate synthase [Saccharothrix variisporea]
MAGRRVAGSFAHVGGRRVHVREDGPVDGPPVVLLHGFGGSLHWFDRLVPLLDGCRVVRVDLLGHGATGGRAADADEQARVVAEVLAQRRISGVTAVGHSFGADVALSLAETCERVTRVVVVAQAPDYSDATFPRGGRLLTLPLVGTLLHRFAPPFAVRAVATHAVAPGFRVGSALARQALEDHRALDAGMFPIVLERRRQRLAQRPLDVRVRESGLPVLVVLGGRDRFYGARSAGRYLEAGARVEIIAEAGHSPVVETPGRTAALVLDFLE